MSKGKKVLILVLLLFCSTSVFGMADQGGSPQLKAFAAIMTVGVFIAIPVVALSRGTSRRERD